MMILFEVKLSDVAVNTIYDLELTLILQNHTDFRQAPNIQLLQWHTDKLSLSLCPSSVFFTFFFLTVIGLKKSINKERTNKLQLQETTSATTQIQSSEVPAPQRLPVRLNYFTDDATEPDDLTSPATI